MQNEGVRSIQIETGGACHLDAPMVKAALDTLGDQKYNLIFVENIGNLVCPAEFDIGESKKVKINPKMQIFEVSCKTGAGLDDMI